MLKKELIDTLAGLAKVDPKILADAISASDEQSVEIPAGIVSYSPDEVSELETNIVNKAKPGIKIAAIEEAAKEQIRTLGLELPDSAKRDLSTVFNTYKQKIEADAKIKPDDQVVKLTNKLKEKDTLIDTLNTEKQTLESSFENYKFSSMVENKALNSFSDGKVLTRDQKLVLFKNRYDVKKSETGAIEVFDKEKKSIVEDAKKNPLPIEAVAKDFDSIFKETQPGRGGGSGEPEPKFTDVDKAREQVLNEGHAKNSKEYYTRLNELLTKD